MSDQEPVDESLRKGPLSWMARNGVAANLLMFVILAAGVIGMLRTKQEVFPEFSLDRIQVEVLYPGASPVEVEQGISLAIEEQVRGIDGIKTVTSTSNEGAAVILAELMLSANVQQALADVKSAIDSIQTFPEEALEPQVSLLAPRREVVSLVLSGDQDPKTLHDLAERVRTDLTTTPGVELPRFGAGRLQSIAEAVLPRRVTHVPAPPITQVDLGGVRNLEIAVEIDRAALDNYGLTLGGVARQIQAGSLELPGGTVKTNRGDILLRLDERRKTVAGFEDIVLRSTTRGQQVRVGDVAHVIDGYEESDQESFFNGRRAVSITAYRVGSETPRGVASVLHAYKDRLRAELPKEIAIDIWKDDSVLLDERIDLLLRNGTQGLILVFIVLALLLDLRLAFWVAMGIPISFMGTFFLMPVFDVSINMISLFAFIVTLGLVVDDAIIVGENIYEYTQRGMSMMDASIKGAQDMVVPVTFSILTTCAAFAPMLMVPGVMGKIFRLMPIIVICVLFFSMLESFLVLPAHLGHQPAAFAALGRVLSPFTRPIDWVRIRTSALLELSSEKVYKPVLKLALRLRYATAALAAASFFVTLGVVGSGFLPSQFFPRIEGDIIQATAKYPFGTPIGKTRAMQEEMEAAFQRAVDRSGGQKIVKGAFSRLGEAIPAGGPVKLGVPKGSHIASIEVNLVSSDLRDINAQELAYRWEEEMPKVAGLESLVFNANIGPSAGAAVEVQLLHADDRVLAKASEELMEILSSYASLTNVQSTYASGKDQFEYELTEQAAVLGLTAADIGNQVRAAFFGAEALREQRGRNEIKVMVRLPEEQRISEYDIEELLITTPTGGKVPLSYVATATRTQSPTKITREQGRRLVSVSAELAKGAQTAQDVVGSLQTELLPELEAKYRGLTTQFAGAQREQGEAMAALGQNFLFAAFVIYALLAVPFRSYTQPLLIMSAIPMGLVGAVMGHLIMGYELSMISMFGIIALAGVVVNDSLVLVDATNQYRAEGNSSFDAVIMGGTRRLRPILLTSLTTFMGLAPMIAEPSVQARFLIPMAISLGFGVLFTTVVTLLLVPALYLILEDILGVLGRIGAVFFPEQREKAAL